MVGDLTARGLGGSPEPGQKVYCLEWASSLGHHGLRAPFLWVTLAVGAEHQKFLPPFLPNERCNFCRLKTGGLAFLIGTSTEKAPDNLIHLTLLWVKNWCDKNNQPTKESTSRKHWEMSFSHIQGVKGRMEGCVCGGEVTAITVVRSDQDGRNSHIS